MYYQPEIETMSRKDLEALQLERLQALVKRVYEKIPFYKESFDKAGVKPEDIKTLDDLTKFPFTVKQDTRCLSLRSVRGSARRSRARTLLFWHYWHRYGGWLYPSRS